jgi:hypothetical protein
MFTCETTSRLKIPLVYKPTIVDHQGALAQTRLINEVCRLNEAESGPHAISYFFQAARKGNKIKKRITLRYLNYGLENSFDYQGVISFKSTWEKRGNTT